MTDILIDCKGNRCSITYDESLDPYQRILLINNFTITNKNDEEGKYFIEPSDNKDTFLLGLNKRVLSYLDGINLSYEIKGLPIPEAAPKIPKDVLEGIELRGYQLNAIRKCLSIKYGIVKIATGGGKTEVMAGTLRVSDLPSLVLVSSKYSMNQTIERFLKRGVTDVGPSLDNKHTVSNIEAFSRKVKKLHKPTIAQLYNKRLVILDECHHTGANSWMSIVSACVNADHRLGFSGTPFSKEDKVRNYSLISATGEVMINVPSSYLIEKGYLLKPTIYMLPCLKSSNRITKYQAKDWAKIYEAFITKNKIRNKLICNVSELLFRKGHKTLIIVERIEDHGYTLLKNLTNRGLKVRFATGNDTLHEYINGTYVKREEGSLDTVTDYAEGKFDILIGTRIFDESADIPCLSSVVIATGGKSNVRTIQRIGRALRVDKSWDKPDPIVIDFYDSCNKITQKHSKNRKEAIIEQEYKCFDSVVDIPAEFLSNS